MEQGNSPKNPVLVELDFLESFLRAWNSHDVEAILNHLDADCLYISGDGDRARGHEEIRKLIAGFLERFPDAHWRDARHFLVGDRGASEWTFTATDANGERLEMDSCDLFTFRDGKMTIVSAWRR